ncbi:MAG: 4Fe-4S binding protein [Planctomycetes bacterium]|nr:4Fe-4S binding protein [Planctomycetota bacterium]
MRTIRIIVQFIFLLLFFFLLFHASYTDTPDGRVSPAIDGFMQADPLIALTTALSSRALQATMWLALITIALTLVAGRVFCGWICPLGTILDLLRRPLLRKNKSYIANSSPFLLKWKKIKYITLIVILASSVFTALLTGFLDPIALITRTSVSVFYPLGGNIAYAFFSGLNAVSYEFGDWFYQNFNSLMIIRFTQQSLPIALVFLMIVGLEYIANRAWCRGLCPLGALLAFLSRYRLLNRQVSDKCTHCGLCASNCKMNAIPKGKEGLCDTRECVLCGRCVSVCPENAIKYNFSLPKGVQEESSMDLSRRQFLLSTAGGALGAGLFVSAYFDPEMYGECLRPPGVDDEKKFLEKCVRCGECVKICCTSGKGLQPASMESGWKGVWSPVFKFRHGWCEYNCNLCGQVCPTGAIPDMKLEEKKKFQIGIARIDRNKCIPWYKNDIKPECIRCEEMCPVPDKAIKFRKDRIIVGFKGEEKEVEVLRPYVVEELCIGCGKCETYCPVDGRAAIKVVPVQDFGAD